MVLLSLIFQALPGFDAGQSGPAAAPRLGGGLRAACRMGAEQWTGRTRQGSGCPAAAGDGQETARLKLITSTELSGILHF